MDRKRNGFTILMADDDADDYYLLKEALDEKGASGSLRLVSDGAELLDYLLRRGRFAEAEEAPRPVFVLLDLNMPKKDGREALIEIKSDPRLKEIPIIVFTTSREETDIRGCYEAGANSYITKPASFEKLLETVDILMRYWIKTVDLPASFHEGGHITGCATANA